MIFNIIKVGLVRGFGALSGFLLIYFVTQTVDVAEAGMFSIVFTAVSVLGMLLTGGANQFIIKKAALFAREDRLSVLRPFMQVCCTALVLASLMLVVLVLVPFKFAIVDKFVLILAVVASFFFALNQLSTSVLLGVGAAGKASVFQNILPPITFLLVGCVVFVIDPMLIEINLILLLFCISYIAAAIISYLFLMYELPGGFRVKPQLKAADRKTLFALFVVLSMELAVHWAGHLVSVFFLTKEELALFATALRMAMLTSFVLIAVNLVVAPKLAQAYKQGGAKQLSRITLFASRFMVIVAVPVLLVMVLLAEQLMGFFGEQYKEAAVVLAILACGQFVNVVSGSVANTLIMTGHEKDFRNVVVVTGPVAIFLAVFLISEFGIMGAAFATAISVAMQNLLAVYMVKKRLGFNILNIFRSA